MFCTNCGSQVNDGSVFCPNCGAQIGSGASGVSMQPAQPMRMGAPLLLLNIDYIPGKKIEVLGMVKGNSAQARNVGKDLMAGFKNMVGGEISGYSDMTSEARRVAVGRMEDEARALGADAVINIRYGSASLAVQGIVEVLAYGTAVKVRDE